MTSALNQMTSRGLTLLFLALVAVPESTALFAQELRYTSKPQQTFAYKVDISADRNDATELLQGVVTFTVKGSSGESVRLGYYGGLTKTRKAKPGSSSASSGRGPSRGGPARGGPSRGGPRGGPRRGPGGPARRGGPSIFSNPFAGLTQTSNELVVTPQGEVQTLKGSSQLPYLLGNLSILFFEPLPDEGQSQWTIHNGVSITEGGGRSSRPPFHRPSPFTEDEKRTAAAESTSFTIENSDEERVVAAKTYRLNMPAGADDATSYEITGSGKWTFNRQLQVPESLDFKQKLIVQDGNATITIPIAIRYSRLSAEELAAHQEKRKEMVAALKKKQEERKNAGQQGLPAEKKQEILANLNSDKTQVITRQMVQLKIMKPHPDDKDIARLIQKHIDSTNRPLRVMAQAAWGRWKVLVEEPAAAATAATDNPFDPAAAATKLRTWKDASGRFTVEAEFVSLSGDALTIKRKDGKEVTVPLSRLSEEDQAAARKLAK